MVQEFRGKCRKGLCRETAPILFGLSDQLLRLRELNWHIDAQSPRQGTNPDWLCGEDEGLSRSREKKEQQQFVHRLEKEIAELEQKQKEWTAELEKPETYQQPGRAMEINRELIYAQERLAELGPEWEAASLKLAETE